MELGNLANSVVLGLGRNALTGPIPAELGNLAELQNLYLWGNELTGSIPAELGNLANLERLYLDRNALTDQTPQSFVKLEKLRLFRIWGNDGLCVPGTSAFVAWLREIENPPESESLCNAADVAALKLLYEITGGAAWTQSNGWAGDGAVEDWHGVRADSLGLVTALDLSRNGLTGRVPSRLGNLTRMTELRIGGNALTGRIPLGLAELSLRTFHYAGTELCAPANASFRGWLNGIPSHEGTGVECDREVLEILYTEAGGSNWVSAENWLTDTPLGEWYGVETTPEGRVSRLLLSGNALTGPIPPELGNLANLTTLELTSNDLSGPIPPELGNLASLRSLWLSGNDLSGPIPPELGNLASLRSLFLYNNALTGPIPPEIGRMSSLWQLLLTNNSGMAGSLPTELTALGQLEELMAGGTGLCIPSDPDFRAWLETVRKRRRIASCAGASMAYLTQAVQSREFPIPLVAGEKALLRVFPTTGHTTGEGIPPVRARFYVNGRETYAVEIPGTTVPIPGGVDEGRLSKSANAEIPGEIVHPGLAMVIEIDPEGTLDAGLGVPRRIPETGRQAVDVRKMPIFDLTAIPFLWAADPDSAILTLTAGMAADPEGHELLESTRILLPVGDLDVTAHEPVMSSSNNGYVLLDQARAIRAMEGGTGHYMGMMSGSSTGPSGVATGNWVSFAKPGSELIAHELGHNMGLSHAPCGGAGGPDPSYPYPGGSIGAWGYDFRDGGRLVPPGRPDLMGYCGPRWISDYHFTNALGFRLFDEVARTPAITAKSLLLWGGMDADSVPYLEPAFVVEAPAVLPDSTGEHRLTGRTASGGELFSLDFAMPEIADADGGSSFAFVLPVRSGVGGHPCQHHARGTRGFRYARREQQPTHGHPAQPPERTGARHLARPAASGRGGSSPRPSSRRSRRAFQPWNSDRGRLAAVTPGRAMPGKRGRFWGHACEVVALSLIPRMHAPARVVARRNFTGPWRLGVAYSALGLFDFGVSGPISIEARLRIASGKQPLPALQHPVDLPRRPAVDHRRREPRGSHELARPGQAGTAVLEPAPVGQLLGQRAGVVKLAALRDDVQRLLRMIRCQGSSAHLPGSNRAGYRAAARSTASMSGSLRPATQPAP